MLYVLLGVLPLVFRDFGFVRLHVKLRSPFAADDGQTFLGSGLETAFVHSAVLVFGFHVQNVLHVQLERVGTSGPNHARPLVHFEPTAGCGRRNMVGYRNLSQKNYNHNNTNCCVNFSEPISVWYPRGCLSPNRAYAHIIELIFTTNFNVCHVERVENVNCLDLDEYNARPYTAIELPIDINNKNSKF